MKKSVYIFVFPLMLAATSMLKAQNYAEGSLGLPGDNLNLFAVMKLFQESETLEGFERNLNEENSRINNLDLNGDNRIDYIRVIDKPDGEVHLIVLQVAINVRENQDVAVFIVQRENNNQVRIQLIGDEALYGKNYIIEPNYAEYTGETPNPGYMGTTTVVDGQTVVVNRVTAYEVAAWPLISFLYLPTYVAWHSPWYWDYYPTWWHTWHPYYWHYYYGYHYNWYPQYYGYYSHSHNHHQHHYYHDHYYSHRMHSSYVAEHIHSGHYKTTYSRPETRRAGSELYARTYSNDSRRTATRTLGNSQTGRTTTKSDGNTTYGRRDISKPVVGTETTRTLAHSKASTSASRRQTEATASKPATKSTTTKSTVRTESGRTLSDSRISTSTSRRPAETTASRPVTKSADTKSTVRTETRRTVTESKASNSNAKKSTANTPRKSQTRETSGAGSHETADRKPSGRR
jgi:hypothetical protein